MKVLTGVLDGLVRPEIHIFNRSWCAYQVCGYTGLSLAILLAMTLIAFIGLSAWVMMGIIVMAILTFLGLAMATKIITGEEQLIYYHHEIAIMFMAVLLLKITKQPMLPYLDIAILGIGTFLACGRVGCLMVGCCHGRPHRWGVRYRKEHADAGFTRHYVGIRLFPIQAVESIWVLMLVIVGCIIVLGKQAPGEAMAWYVITYDFGRFCFEFLRGDPDRPYYWGISEAQWISVVLMCAVASAELSGFLVFHSWHIVATVAMISAIIVLASARRFGKAVKYKLLNPRHVKEVAETIEQVSGRVEKRRALSGENQWPEAIPIGCTSLGIQISAGQIRDAGASIDHYTISAKNGTMNREVAGILADMIIQLKHPSSPMKLIDHTRGVFHVLIQPQTAGGGI